MEMKAQALFVIFILTIHATNFVTFDLSLVKGETRVIKTKK